MTEVWPLSFIIRNAQSVYRGIHARSSESKYDESSYASMVAKEKIIDLKVITPAINQFTDVLEDVVYTKEEPFGSPSIVMQYMVMKTARQSNCTVMLDGQGGDGDFTWL